MTMQPQDHLAGPLTWQIEDLGKRIRLLEETITQLKTLDTTLHEMQFIIYSYVEKIREGVVLMQDETIVWANKAGCDMLGFEFDEVVNKSVIEIAHPKHRQQLSARYALVQAGDETYDATVWPFVSKTREIKYIKPHSTRVMYMGRPAVMAFFSDITEEKKAQDELTLRAEMLDLVTDSIFLLDMKGNIKYVNKAVCECLGYTLDEFIRLNILDINAQELREKTEVSLKKAFVRKQGVFKTIHVHKDGTRVPVYVRVRVVKRGGQEFILGVVREIVGEEESL
ncbi:MAG: PAS domain-containing protein [Dehalococcoidia bacterium]|nr:PAS domain-containing protein [Dehalococcoidia bacterium]